MIITGEKVYKTTNVNVKYVLEEGNQNKKHLVVVFSSVSPPDHPIRHAYNYRKTLKDFDCHRLFILDGYGESGCYYLGKDMKFNVESSVMSLITYIVRKLNINWENIIVAGSSKGGSAALYFGLKYNIGNIVAGVPQTKIADAVLDEHMEIAEYIMGREIDDSKIKSLNSIIYEQLNKEILSNIHIMTSENDEEYETQVKPFVEELRNRQVDLSLEVNNKMQEHNEIHLYYPNYLINTLLKIMYDFEIIESNINKVDNYNYLIKLDLKGNIENLRLNYIFIDHNNEIHEHETECFEYSVQSKHPALYKVHLEIYKGHNKIYKRYLGQILFGIELN